ncbi:Importin beta-like SAD2 [Galdieria sulphuraria]|nr:Importin beta-like SAD2 [Galdieria sulphuraria]
MKEILQSIIYPYLCFTDKDLDLWRQDPQEYIRDSFDFVQEYFSARSASCSFLSTVACDKSFKVLEPLWKLCMEILQQYSTLPNEHKTKELLARKKYGVIMAIGNMRRKLCGSSQWRQQLKEVLNKYIIYEFQSPFMFLRAATCWLLGELASEDEFPFDSLSLDWLKSYINCLTDQDIVVRVRSIVGLQRLVEQDAIANFLRPYVGHILQTIFQLFGQVDQSELLDTLECLIEKYSQDLAPYATEICEKLRDAFLFYIGRMEGEEQRSEEEEEISLSIIGCLNGIDSMLETVEDEPDKLEIISHILFPIFQGMFHEGREEYLDETFMIIESIFMYSKTVSAYFWSFYPLLFTCVESHSGLSSFLDSIASLLECFVRYGTKEFLTGMSSDGIPYQNRMKSFVQFLLDKTDNIDHEAGLELLGTLLRSCKDRITEHLIFYLDIFIHSLRKSTSQEQAMMNNMGALENTVLSSFFYNDSRTVFELLEKGRILEQAIQRWIESSRDLDTKRETKIFVLGASELMAKVASQRFAEYSSLFILVGTRLVQILNDSLLKAEQSAISRKILERGSLDNASIQDIISSSFDSEEWEVSSEDSDTLESVDEFEYFTEVFQWLNTVQPQVWLSCANSSTVDMQSLLQKLEQQRKVKVSNP